MDAKAQGDPTGSCTAVTRHEEMRAWTSHEIPMMLLCARFEAQKIAPTRKPARQHMWRTTTKLSDPLPLITIS